MKDSVLLELKGVVKNYGRPGGTPLPVLRGIDLQVAEGESVAVTGPSGSGKSTLLNLIGTLDRADGGKLFFGGRDLSALMGKDLYRFRRSEIGFVFQRHHLLPHLTTLENVLVPTLVDGRPGDTERALGLLEKLGLADRLDHRPGQLSGGECQRTAVARALVNSPRLLLADEPTGSLDREGAEELGDLLADLNRREGVTLLMVTHSAALALKTARAFDLRDGFLRERTAR